MSSPVHSNDAEERRATTTAAFIRRYHRLAATARRSQSEPTDTLACSSAATDPPQQNEQLEHPDGRKCEAVLGSFCRGNFASANERGVSHYLLDLNKTWRGYSYPVNVFMSKITQTTSNRVDLSDGLARQCFSNVMEYYSHPENNVHCTQLLVVLNENGNVALLCDACAPAVGIPDTDETFRYFWLRAHQRLHTHCTSCQGWNYTFCRLLRIFPTDDIYTKQN